jgi:hypothetical protein
MFLVRIRLVVTKPPLKKKKTTTAICPEYVNPFVKYLTVKSTCPLRGEIIKLCPYTTVQAAISRIRVQLFPFFCAKIFAFNTIADKAPCKLGIFKKEFLKAFLPVLAKVIFYISFSAQIPLPNNLDHFLPVESYFDISHY